MDCQSLKRKSNKKADFGNWHSESLDDNILMDTLQPHETGVTNEVTNKILRNNFRTNTKTKIKFVLIILHRIVIYSFINLHVYFHIYQLLFEMNIYIYFIIHMRYNLLYQWGNTFTKFLQRYLIFSTGRSLS